MQVQDNIVVSGDKKGQVAVWDFHKVTERSVYNTHKALTNHVRFIPSSDGAACCSAATDGTLKVSPPKQIIPETAVLDGLPCLMRLEVLPVGPAMLVACQPSDKVAFLHHLPDVLSPAQDLGPFSVQASDGARALCSRWLPSCKWSLEDAVAADDFVASPVKL